MGAALTNVSRHFGKNLLDADLVGASSLDPIVRPMTWQAAKVAPGDAIVSGDP